MNRGKLIVFSAPSGAGKTTLVKHALEIFKQDLAFSISCTTRQMREGETHGKDYYFLDLEDFKQKIEQNEFIEWEEVYTNNFYGTLKSEVDRLMDEGKSVIFDIDVEGGLNIKKLYGKDCLTVFVHPPSINSLKERLRARNTETEEKLKQRLEKADLEIATAPKFDVVLWNDDLDKAKNETVSIIRNFLNLHHQI
ncbi:guanylate kinase [Vaginella massiliensis]|uniref:guanylate kinase n=1 Tax=Vaginella massiliensis TaxID=1816680 RepID=UPI000839ACA7|nr:guanylate kinase [Vaginella massiliensis]